MLKRWHSYTIGPHGQIWSLTHYLMALPNIDGTPRQMIVKLTRVVHNHRVFCQVLRHIYLSKLLPFHIHY